MCILWIEFHTDTDMLVQLTGKLLMERLFLFETGNENLEELLESRHCQIFSAIVINCHLLDLGVLLYQLLLLRF